MKQKVWLKIRDRKDISRFGFTNQKALIHLDYWLNVFKDDTKYEVYIYNENFTVNNDHFKNKNISDILNRKDVNKKTCGRLNDLINKSQIKYNWKGAAFALSAPYFYFEENDEYVWNIDSDDLLMENDINNKINKVYDFCTSEKLTTISHDLIFSYNSTEKNHHWTFGLNLSHLPSMKKIILNNINDEIKNTNGRCGVNLDLVVDNYLEFNNNKDEYHCFITENKFWHMGVYNIQYIGNDVLKIFRNDRADRRLIIIDDVRKHKKTKVL